MSTSDSPAASPPAKPMNPVIGKAMKYSLSPKEYQTLYKYLLARTPIVGGSAPTPASFEKLVLSSGDYNASTVRVSARLFTAALAGLRTWEYLAPRLFARGQPIPVIQRPAFWKQTSVRLSASLSFILLFHRLLSRFLQRLRDSLLTDNAKSFRHRNPGTSGVLTSQWSPVIGSALAGYFLAVYPATQLRITITLYMFTRSLEFLYNHLDNRGYTKNKPWWFGSWLLMPATCAQLLHALVFDRETFPASYGNLILNNSKTYLHAKPAEYAADLKWPATPEIIDNLGEISRLRWPKFVSPIMLPDSKTLPASLALISPITSSAHPTVENLSCALLHPNDPSCTRTYLTFFLQAFPGIVRYFTVLFGAFSLLRLQAFIKYPVPAFSRLAKLILKTSFFVTGAVGTAWGSICLLQNILPRNVLPTKRWLLSGALGGSWAFIHRDTGRSDFLFTTRLSLDSLWKVGVKRGWWKGVKNGDVLLFTASLALMQILYVKDPAAINSPVVRKALGLLKGDGWVDKLEAKTSAEKETESKKSS